MRVRCLGREFGDQELVTKGGGGGRMSERIETEYTGCEWSDIGESVMP